MKEENQLELEAPCHHALKPHLSFSIWVQKPASILKYIHSSQQVSKPTVCSHRHKFATIFGGQFYNSEVNAEPWWPQACISAAPQLKKPSLCEIKGYNNPLSQP